MSTCILVSSVNAQPAGMRKKLLNVRTSQGTGDAAVVLNTGLGGTASMDTILRYNDGRWIGFIQDTVIFSRYPGKNRLTSLDTLLVIDNGKVFQTHRSNLTIPYTQISNRPSLATVATSGSYNDLVNKPTIPVVNTPAATNPVRTFNSAFQVSTTRNAQVQYTAQIVAAISLAVGQTGTIYLETSPNNSTWTIQDQFTNGNTGTLAVGFSLTQTMAQSLGAYVPAGYWVRLRTTGNATITYITSQEVQL